MPRPKTKVELLALSQENYKKLLDLINDLPKDLLEEDFPPGTLNRNIRDVLAHLHHWHLMLFNWYEVGMQGEKPEMPAPGYTWKTTSDLNKKIQQQYSSTPLFLVIDKFNDSHRKIHDLIEKHSNEELFTKKMYPWTGSTSLGAYLVSSTSSHYDWALKLIKKCLKPMLINS